MREAKYCGGHQDDNPIAATIFIGGSRYLPHGVHRAITVLTITMGITNAHIVYSDYQSKAISNQFHPCRFDDRFWRI